MLSRSTKPPAEAFPDHVNFIRCDVTSWAELYRAFRGIKQLDMVFTNAGISESNPLLGPEFEYDAAERLPEPEYPVLKVNLRATLNTVKLAWSKMRTRPSGGRIIMTTSSIAYFPCAALPVYVASKSAVCHLLSLINRPAVCARNGKRMRLRYCTADWSHSVSPPQVRRV